MERVIKNTYIVGTIISHLTFSDMSRFSRASRSLNSTIKSITMTVDEKTGQFRGLLTQYNFLTAFENMKTKKVRTNISEIASVLLKHGTEKSIRFIIVGEDESSDYTTIDRLELLFPMMQITAKMNDRHPVVDMLINADDVDEYDRKQIFTIALFSRNHHYIQIYGEEIKKFYDQKETYTNSYCEINSYHRFTRLAEDELNQILGIIPEDCHEEIKCYSDLIFSIDTTSLSKEIRDNAIILNQASPDIKKILEYFSHNDPIMQYFTIADFTAGQSGCDLFIAEYKKNPNFIHKINFEPSVKKLASVFPEIFNKEKLTSELKIFPKSTLFLDVLDDLTEWLYDDFASQNADMVNKPAKYRGNVRCIADDYIHNVINYDVFGWLDIISYDAMINYIQTYLTTHSGKLSAVMKFLEYIDAENSDEAEKIKELARDVFEYFITNDKKLFRFTHPEQFVRVAQKYEIDIAGFFARYNMNCLTDLTNRNINRMIAFSLEVSEKVGDKSITISQTTSQ